ncbi:MAG: stage 0 sporulation family protein [Oscillospiraceae bacterium]
MTEIIGVRFKAGGKEYFFSPQGTTVSAGQGVLLSTSRGTEYAECVRGNTQVEDDAIVPPLRNLLRVATQQDLDTVSRNKLKEKEAARVCQQKIIEHKLDMKLVEVEYSFDGSKILFFFTSENRVDFRNLVKDLAAQFRARIELRQIGVRDEAKLLGGLGICGKPFCCNQFLGEFAPVSIKMAKTQNLSLNPTKISGTCGRLMCCLKYEQHAYEDAARRCPKQESFVETPDGAGTVYSVNLLREKVKVRLEDSAEQAKYYYNSEVKVIRNGKGKRPEDYVAPPKSELEARRFVPEKQEEIVQPTTALSSALADIFTATDAPKPVRPAPRPNTNRSANPPSAGSRPAGDHRPQGQNRPKPVAPKPPKIKSEDDSAPLEKLPVSKNRNRRWRGKPRGNGGGTPPTKA